MSIESDEEFSQSSEPAESIPSHWREMWTDLDGDTPDPREVQAGLRARRHRLRWKSRLTAVCMLLGVTFTIGLLLTSPPAASIVVLCVFCWLVWGTSMWMKWRVSRVERRALTRAPAKFVETLRQLTESRASMIRTGRYLLVAVGVFCAVWVSWFVSENWAVYQQEPWRAVVGVGGVIVLYFLVIYLQHREQKQLEDDLTGLEQLERQLASEGRSEA